MKTLKLSKTTNVVKLASVSVQPSKTSQSIAATFAGESLVTSPTLVPPSVSVSTLASSFAPALAISQQVVDPSRERPELLMMMNFKPLYDQGDQLTDAGEFVHLNDNVRALRDDDARQLVKAASDASPVVKRSVTDRLVSVTDHLSLSYNALLFLQDMLNSADDVSRKLDLRHDVYTQRSFQDTGQNSNPTVSSLARVGYSKKLLDTLASSTKLWVLLVLELRDMCSHQSTLMLGKKRSMTPADDAINVDLTRTFFTPDKSVALTLEQLVAADVKKVVALQDQISSAFRVLSKAVGVSQSARVSLVLSALAKDFRYSSAIGERNVTRNTSVVIAVTNVSQLRQTFGPDLADVSSPSSPLDGSILSLAYVPSPRGLIATLENNALVGSSSLLPGSIDLISNAFDVRDETFVVDRLVSFLQRLERSSQIIDELDQDFSFSGISAVTAQTRGQVPSEKIDLRDPSVLSNVVINSFKSVLGDQIVPLIALAQSNDEIKSLLFSRVMLMTKPGVRLLDENVAQTLAAISERLMQTVSLSLTSTNKPTMSSGKKVITNESFLASLKTSTPLLDAIDSLFARVRDTLVDSRHFALQDTRTRYFGVTDAAFMMMFFDSVVNVIAMSSDSRFESVGVTKTSQTEFVVVTRAKQDQQEATKLVTSTIVSEQRLVASMLSSVKICLGVLRETLTSFKNKLTATDTLQRLSSALELLEDKSHIASLLKGGQTSSVLSEVLDMRGKLASNIDEQLVVFDDISVAPKTKDVFHAVFSALEFTSPIAVNKRVFSIGLTNEAIRKARRSLLRESRSTRRRQEDMIDVVINKVALDHRSIVYKPITFTFELSRFVSRMDALLRPLPEDVTVDRVFETIPMRDFSSTSTLENVQYWSVVRASSAQTAFSDDEYSFLSHDERAGVIKNHMMSYLLEVYVRSLAGISLSEREFAVFKQKTVEDPGMRTFVDHVLATPPSKIAGQVTKPSKEPFKGVNAASSFVKPKPNFIDAGALNNVQVMKAAISADTSVIDGRILANKLLRARKFDRVFNVIVDPDDFIVDREKTVASPAGKAALDAMLLLGQFISVDDSDDLRHVDRDNDDALFEQYYVTIEATR